VDQHQALYCEVGRRIRDARTKRTPRLTQEALAGLVSLTRTSITNIEKGRQKILLHTLSDIAEAIHVPLTSLLPTPDTNLNQHLEEALKHRPELEKDWIKSTVTAARKEKSDGGA